MGTIKTQPTDADVDAFLESVADPRRRADAHALRALIEHTTGASPLMWGSSIVGFGAGRYTSAAGSNDWFVVGFSPRKAGLSVYGVHEEDGRPDALLDGLGPHTVSKGCLSIKRMADVDGRALTELIRRAWERAHDAES